MRRIPEQYSLRWLHVFLGYFLLVYALISLPPIFFDSEIVLRPLLSLAMLSIGVALFPCVAGFLGGKVFFAVYSLFTVFAAVNMLNFSLLTGSFGWGDLRPYLIFLSFAAMGAGAGLAAQTAHALYRLGEKRQTH